MSATTAGRAAAGRRGPAWSTGHGIVGMRERIGAFGGWLVAGPVAAAASR